jgi:LacI family transcriptional regulator
MTLVLDRLRPDLGIEPPVRRSLPRRVRVEDIAAAPGVDDDPVTSTSAAPALSTIACDWQRLGHEAAALLEEQMVGAPSPRADARIPPLGLVRRRSTEVVAIEDPGVAAAVEFIRDNISQVFCVEALLRVSRMPRRSLEMAFRQSVGCTPYAYITHARLARAKELLAAPTARTLTEIAAACGFRDLRRFRLVFRREVGIGPAEYRATQRKTGA